MGNIMTAKLKIIFFLVLISTNYKVEGLTRVDPLVHTKIGLIRGLRATDGDYSMFMGIPFAQVNKTNPFGPATPQPPFEDTFEAYDDSAICPQVEEINNTIVGTLDCLHINVYVPSSASSQNRLPVLVWIYGGGFTIGFGGKTLYGPKYLVRHDVILVTINYRLGPYGFMCLGTPEVPGNQGLKDQLLGLRWVKENMESFGGDVNQITIMGESAGGKSVDMHVYSKAEKLFDKVIMQSGTAFLPLGEKEADITSHFKLAKLIGFETTDPNKALSFLAAADPMLVIAASQKLALDYFSTCIEKELEDVETFLTEYPINIDLPKAKNIPILLGTVAEELWFDYVHANTDFFESWNGFIDNLKTQFTFNDEELYEIEKIIRHFYIGDESVDSDVKHKLAEFETDFLFVQSTERTIDKYLDNGAANVYYYMFSYVGEINWSLWKNNITEGGATHADEISYLFDVVFWRNENLKFADQTMIDRMTKMWTNFAKYGDPTPVISELLPVKWEPITSKTSPRFYMDLDEELTLKTRPHQERMAFWELFYRVYKNKVRGYKGSNKN